MQRKTRIAEVRRALLPARRVLIVSHRNPDGDAMGSSLALLSGLLTLGKTCEVVNTDGVPANLVWLPLAERVGIAPERGDYDTVVFLDCGNPDRPGVDLAPLRGARWINIDHHPGNGEFGHANLVDPAACATAELVYEVLVGLQVPVGFTAATNIYTAILTDTGCFRFSNSNARAFEIASRMVGRGVDPSWVAQMVYDQQPVNRLRLLSRVLETLELSPRDKAACVVVTQDMFRATHTGVEDVEGFVNYPRSVCGVEVGFLLREEPDGRYRVAFRSKGRVDVAEIAREFGGGGHRNAAGATVEGTAPQIRQRIFDRVEAACDELLLARREVG
ncbi:DHH family phosphoesterase [Deferrisoma camini]|uniref:DHH family phosphoesterase n=1 Tax=Deferrisoma camini TaxID=1035120 RepID=UPI0004B803C9|nr:bifunctional oligoribonuclease/PAP phosphatase NrnA [Deferrisoma camini]